MPKRMAYLPPENTLAVGSSCYLVFLPDDPVYRAAFWGAYSDLAQYWKWAEDDPTRREEITASWLSAIALTQDCLAMGICDELLPKLDAILAAINNTACCFPGTNQYTYNEWNVITTGDDQAVPDSPYDSTNRPPDYATDPTGATPFTAELLDDYLCAMAHLIWTIVNNILLYGQSWTGSILSALAVAQQIAFWLLDKLFSTGSQDARRLSLWLMAEFNVPTMAAIATVNQAAFTGALAEWELAKDDFICTLTGEDGADNWKIAADTLFATIFSESVIAAAISGFVPASFFALVWNGLLKPDAWADEPCCEGQVLPTNYFGTSYTGTNFPAGWVNDVGPHFDTNTEYNVTGALQDASSGDVAWICIRDDSLTNNPLVPPTQWQVKFTGWVQSGYAEGLIWYNATTYNSIGTPTASVLNASMVNGQWYDAPPNVDLVRLLSANGSTPQLFIRILEA